MDKTEILEALHELGFRPELVDEFGYVFGYEGINLVYAPDDDKSFFRISAPFIYEVEDEDMRPVILDIINDLNVQIKYSKTLLVDDHVWASLEVRLFDGMEPEALVRFAVIMVRATVRLFQKMLKGYNARGEEDSDNAADTDSGAENDSAAHSQE